MKTMVLGHECRSSCCRVDGEKGQEPHPAWPPEECSPTPSTHNLSFSAPEVQEKETGTIIRGHLQLLKGLAEQYSSGHTGLSCPQCEALVNVHREAAGTAVPCAGCGTGNVDTGTAGTSETTSPTSNPTGNSKSGA